MKETTAASGAYLLFCAIAVVAALAEAEEGSPAPYYRNDFEERLDLAEWSTVARYDLHTLALSDEIAHSGKRSAKLDYTVVEPGHRSYFQVSFETPWRPEDSYVADGWVWVDAPVYVSVSLGVNWRIAFGGKSTDGCYSVTSSVEERRRWVRLTSRDLRPTLADDIRCRGYSPRSKMTIIGIYLNILGRVQEGDRVTLYVDDLSLTPATNEIRRLWAAEDAKMQAELDYRGSPHTEIEKTFVWGVGGSPQGLSRILDLPLEVCASLVARDWRENFFDSCIQMGGVVRADRPIGPQVQRATKLLDLAARHGFRMQMSAFLSGYSKGGAFDPKVNRDDCDQIIRRVVSRFQSHPGLLAWYILDEPRAEWAALRDHWIWAKKRIEAIDHQHPVVAAFNSPRSARYYAPYSAITQIDWYPIAMRTGRYEGMLHGHGAMAGGAMCDAARQSGARTVWFIPQAYACLRKRRLPTAAELRLQTYLALAHGATGILYYQYQNRPLWHLSGGERTIVDLVFARRHEMGHEVRRLARTIPTIAPVLIGAERVADSGIAVQGPELAGLGAPAIQAELHRAQDYDVVVACNLDVESRRTGRATLPRALLRGRGLWDLHARTPVALADDSSFALDLAPGDGRFFALADEPVARRLFREVDRRHFDKLKKVLVAELAEAEAVGVDAAEAREAVLKQEGGVSAIERALQSLQEALAAHKPYVGCKQRLAALQTTVSDANWEFENVVAKVPWHPTTTEYRQPRRIAAAMYKPYGDLILQAARAYYCLRYGLTTGRLDECRRALPACESLAQEALRLVTDLRDDKYVGTPAIWRIYHPITPRLHELMTRCEELTKPLQASLAQ